MSDDMKGLGESLAALLVAKDNVGDAGGGPVGEGPVGGMGKAADASPDNASLLQKQTDAFVLNMLCDDLQILRGLEVPGIEEHEKFGCGMLHVIEPSVFHRKLMEMIKKDTEGIWPVKSEHPTWAVYSMLRQNGFKEIYFGYVKCGVAVKERGAPPGEMMWYKRYRYSHAARMEAEGAAPLSEADVLALATSG